MFDYVLLRDQQVNACKVYNLSSCIGLLSAHVAL